MNPERKVNIRHGDRPKGKKTRIYSIWLCMRERCNNKNHRAFARYGGRGIKVCEEWNDYATFKEWAWANGYKDGLTIDRIDNDGDYEPTNCKWSTSKEQANNRCTNRILEIDGIERNIQEWCEITGLPRYIADGRLRRGWSAERIFSTPILTKGGKVRE